MMLSLHSYFLHVFIVTFLIITQCKVLASDGDRSQFYQNCLRKCSSANCTEDGKLFLEPAKQEFWSQLFLWGCKEECQYHCMWKTVAAFNERGYDIPKFHGKWPFIRMYGVQEPASAFASLLNLASHLYMQNKLKRRLRAMNNALARFWTCFVFVCLHAWCWSTVFHTRDTLLTEFMDYACALSMVLALFAAAVVRVLQRRRKMAAALVCGTLLFYVKHVCYLYSGRIDYGYNMFVNIGFGVAASLIWLVWAVRRYTSGHRYVWRLIAFLVLSGVTLSLELYDFPPKVGMWDAHALWHLSTAPLPLLFYRFVIDDITHLDTEYKRILSD